MMRWTRTLISVIRKADNLKALDQRHNLWQKIGKIVPLTKTDVGMRHPREDCRQESSSSSDIFTVEKERNKQVTKLEGKTTKARQVNADDDEASQEFSWNYLKNVVLPRAIDRYLDDLEREKNNASGASIGRSSDVSKSVSELVQKSLSNPRKPQRQEQEMNKEINHHDYKAGYVNDDEEKEQRFRDKDRI